VVSPFIPVDENFPFSEKGSVIALLRGRRPGLPPSRGRPTLRLERTPTSLRVGKGSAIRLPAKHGRTFSEVPFIDGKIQKVMFGMVRRSRFPFVPCFSFFFPLFFFFSEAAGVVLRVATASPPPYFSWIPEFPDFFFTRLYDTRFPSTRYGSVRLPSPRQGTPLSPNDSPLADFSPWRRNSIFERGQSVPLEASPFLELAHLCHARSWASPLRRSV